VFETGALKKRRERIESLVARDALGDAVKSAIEAAAAAMIITTSG
jgi:hypothetical protein